MLIHCSFYYIIKGGKNVKRKARTVDSEIINREDQA